MQRALTHRLKNMISVIDAMSRQTLRSTTSPEEFGHAFSSRLQALNHAQIALSDNGMTGADLRALIRSQLLRHGEDERILCDGPDVSRGARGLCFVAHEPHMPSSMRAVSAAGRSDRLHDVSDGHSRMLI